MRHSVCHLPQVGALGKGDGRHVGCAQPATRCSVIWRCPSAAARCRLQQQRRRSMHAAVRPAAIALYTKGPYKLSVAQSTISASSMLEEATAQCMVFILQHRASNRPLNPQLCTCWQLQAGEHRLAARWRLARWLRRRVMLEL